MFNRLSVAEKNVFHIGHSFQLNLIGFLMD